MGVFGQIMFSLDEKLPSSNFTRLQSVQTLIVGRLIVIFLLLVTSWAWYSGTLDLDLDSFPKGPFLIFVVSVGLTAVYFLLLRLSSQVAWQIRAHFCSMHS